MLRKRLQGNLIANVYTLMVNTLIQLGSVPVFLAYWPKELYGEWLLLYSIPGYLALADVGLSSVAANDAAIRSAAGDRAGAERSIHTATGFLMIMSIMVFVFMGAVAWLLPWKELLGIKLTDKGTVSWVVLLLSAYSVLGLTFNLFSAVYRCALRTPRGAWIGGSSRLFEFLAMIGCLISHSGFVTQAAALLVVRGVFVLLMYYDGVRISPGLGIGLSGFSVAELKHTWKPAVGFMGFPIGSSLYFQGLTIVVGHTLGSVGVVAFNTVRAFTRATVQTLNIVKQAILPEFSHLFGQRDFGKSKRLFGLSLEVSLIVAVVQAVVLYLTGPWLVVLWTHGAVSVSRGTLLIYLLGTSLNSLWLVCSGLLFGLNRHAGLMVLYVFCSAVAVATVAGLGGSYGISSAGWSMLACEVVMLPYALNKCCTLIGQPVFQFLAEVIIFRELRALRFAKLWTWAKQ